MTDKPTHEEETQIPANLATVHSLGSDVGDGERFFSPSDVLLHVVSETDLTLAHVAEQLCVDTDTVREWIQDEQTIPQKVVYVIAAIGKRLYDPTLMNTTPSVRASAVKATIKGMSLRLRGSWVQPVPELGTSVKTKTVEELTAEVERLRNACSSLETTLQKVHDNAHEELEANNKQWSAGMHAQDAALTADINRAVTWGREQEKERQRLSSIVHTVRLWALGLDAGDVLTDADFELLTQAGLFNTKNVQEEQVQVVLTEEEETILETIYGMGENPTSEDIKNVRMLAYSDAAEIHKASINSWIEQWPDDPRRQGWIDRLAEIDAWEKQVSEDPPTNT